MKPKFRRGMTFSQTKKKTISIGTNIFNYLFKFIEKNYKKKSLDSRFKNLIQTTVSGTEHSVTTAKNKILHRKLISYPLSFQQTITAPTKRTYTRQNNADQPTCSKTLDSANNGATLSIFSRKEAPKLINHERSEDWLKKIDQPQNNKGK